MLSLQSKLYQLGTAFSAAVPNCYHYWRPVENLPCLMWAESGEESSFYSDNMKTEQNITGTCDFYTKTEFDPLIDAVQSIFETLGITWALNSVQYEQETNLIHYEWTWGVAIYGEVPSGAGDGPVPDPAPQSGV